MCVLGKGERSKVKPRLEMGHEDIEVDGDGLVRVRVMLRVRIKGVVAWSHSKDGNAQCWYQQTEIGMIEW